MDKDSLVRLLEQAAEAYYNTSIPVMSDEQYDLLIEQLREIDPDHPLLYKVGARPMGVTFKHSIPAGSQEKLKDKNAFDRWIRQAQDYGCRRYALGYKYDGLTAVLDYANGKLVRGLLRGDGIEGEDISANIVKMKNVKLCLPSSFTGSLRGEIILAKSDFEKYFKPLAYTNPRNSASGVCRDQKGTGLCEHLSIIYFDIIGNEGGETEEDRLAYAKSLGLEVAETCFFSDPEEMWQHWIELASKRDALDYEIDGTVVRVNDINIQKAMGATSDLRPKSQRCLKFEAQGALSELLSVELSIGSNGAIIPTAKLKPVQIGGVTVSSALLGNFQEIERLGIAVGDTVYISRRGDVIPKIEHLIDKPADRKPIIPPTHCIACGAKTEMVGAYLLCTSDTCVGQEFRRLAKYVAKRNIKFLGGEILGELYENHGIKTPDDLYGLTEEFLSNVQRGQGGVVGRGAKVIIEEIQKSRTASLPDFLGCLSIPMLGRRQTAILMELGIDTLEKFMNVTIEELAVLPGFKDAKATAIVNGIKAARPLIEKMLNVLTIKTEEPAVTKPAEGGSLKGMLFCFTGAIEKFDDSGKRFTREMMHQTVRENGGEVTDRVLKNTILVQADPNSVSSKSKKAIQIGAKIMAEKEFWLLVA